MSQQGGFEADETKPLAATPVPTAAPVVATPAGWYPLGGEQR